MVLYPLLDMGLKTSKTRNLSSNSFPFSKSLSNTSLADKFVQAGHIQLLPLWVCCLQEDVGFCNSCQEISV